MLSPHCRLVRDMATIRLLTDPNSIYMAAPAHLVSLTMAYLHFPFLVKSISSFFSHLLFPFSALSESWQYMEFIDYGVLSI